MNPSPLICPCKTLTATITEELLSLWESSVRASHTFLSEEDLLFYRNRLRDCYLAQVDLYTLRNDNAQMLAFMGLSCEAIEMLFVAPAYRGQGIGSQLLEYAVQTCDLRKVDVNEQNNAALAFYRRHGFMVSGRSSHDGEGLPYPILHMELDDMR